MIANGVVGLLLLASTGQAAEVGAQAGVGMGMGMAGGMSTEELDALARDFGYSRIGVGSWQPPPPPAAETVAAVVRAPSSS